MKTAQGKLDDIEGQIVRFRQANAGKLPDNAGTNQSQLFSIDSRINAADDKVNGLQLAKNQLQESKQTAEDMLALLSANNDQTAPSAERASQDLVNMDRQIDAENAILAELQQKYIPTWPKVKEEQAKIQVLKQQRELVAKADEEARAQSQTRENEIANASKQKMSNQQAANIKGQEDRIRQIQADLNNYDHEIQRAQQSKLDLQKQRIELQARIAASPEVEQEYNALINEQKLDKDAYDQLSAKEKDSETTQDIEERHLGEQLDLLDPPQLPQVPVEPNRWMISGAGVGMGLMLGLLMAGAKEAKDTSLKNLKDVRAYTNLPVLTSIPLLENALLVRRKRRLFWLGWSAAIIAGSSAMFIAMTYYMSGRGAQ